MEWWVLPPEAGQHVHHHRVGLALCRIRVLSCLCDEWGQRRCIRYQFIWNKCKGLYILRMLSPPFISDFPIIRIDSSFTHWIVSLVKFLVQTLGVLYRRMVLFLLHQTWQVPWTSGTKILILRPFLSKPHFLRGTMLEHRLPISFSESKDRFLTNPPEFQPHFLPVSGSPKKILK